MFILPFIRSKYTDKDSSARYKNISTILTTTIFSTFKTANGTNEL